MSSHAVEVSPEAKAKNDAFLEDVKSGKINRRVKRHGKMARVTHGTCAICCGLLAISGLFTFIPPLTAWAGQDVVFACRMAHRVFGTIFIAMPLISLFMYPKKALHIWKNLVHSWDSDDKKWMMLFMPYLFMAKWVHMPDQSETKSGQRFADGMIWILGLLMACSGVLLALGTSLIDWGGLYRVWLFLHDLGFCGFAVFGMAHIFLGAGIFQPYRGMHRVMWGDGTVSEPDVMYHWGHWGREVFTTGEEVVNVGTGANEDAKA